MAHAQTVLGKIHVNQLGFVLSHEHLIVKPNNPAPMYKAYTLDDINKSTQESIEFKSVGGQTIVEMTPINYGRDPIALQKIARNSNVNIICTTGFHEKQFLPDWVYTKTDEEIKAIVRSEIVNGIGHTGIFPGVLKIGTSFNKVEFIEKRLIKIISEIHHETGLPISTHCGKGTMSLEQAKLFLEYGVKPSRVILGHVDTMNDASLLLKICELGFNVQVDHVGRDLINKDQEKISLIRSVIENGYIDQLFISGDMGKKEYLHAYGGEPGLSYFLKSLKEELLKYISLEQFNQIFMSNPQRFFAIED